MESRGLCVLKEMGGWGNEGPEGQGQLHGRLACTVTQMCFKKICPDKSGMQENLAPHLHNPPRPLKGSHNTVSQEIIILYSLSGP